MPNYFEIFGLEKSFPLDPALLEKKYFELQRTFHPDRLIGKSDKEKLEAAQKSTDINNGYNILKSPVKRAEHILNLSGISVGDEKGAIKPNQELLMEMLEIREALYESENRDIEKLEKDAAAKYEKTLKDLEVSFQKSPLTKTAEVVIRLKYLVKFQEEIKAIRSKVA